VKQQLTEAEAQERDDRLRAAGIKAVHDPPDTAMITLLKRPTVTEKAKAAAAK